MRRIMTSLTIGLAFAVAAGASGPITRVSVEPSGAGGNDDSRGFGVSADGRFVVFRSQASNLVPGDDNLSSDIFVRDLATNETTCASVSMWEDFGDRHSSSPAISADGRFVVFDSNASNLVLGDTNHQGDVFLRDRLLGETIRVSVDEDGLEVSLSSHSPAISADGRFVAFMSYALEYDSPGEPIVADVIVRDQLTGEVYRASVSTTGEPANDRCDRPSLSADGQVIAFESYATNLVDGDSNGKPDVFVHDRRTGVTIRASVDSTGLGGNGASSGAVVSGDGRLVAFQSLSTQLVPGDTNSSEDVFLHDLSTRVTERVSVDSFEREGLGSGDGVGLSADGRFVAFSSDAPNLVPEDANVHRDIFVRDRLVGVTRRVSLARQGADPDDKSFGAGLSACGDVVAFHSDATNLVEGDVGGRSDVFVRVVSCGAGTVNAGAGAVTDVLLANGSAGGRERRVEIAPHEPLEIVMGLPPEAEGACAYALYAWLGRNDACGAGHELPFGAGATCLPTPLSGGSSRLRVIWNNTGVLSLGAPTRPSSPAPSVVASFASGFERGVFYLQGVIVDPGSAASKRGSVTNGVLVEVR